MQNKLLIMSQPFGLGDVIWAQTIAHEFIKGGYKILWPVDAGAEFLNRAYPEITFIDRKMVSIDLDCRDFKENDGVRYLPLRYAEFLMDRPYKFHMVSKYDFLGLNWHRWREHAMPVRDKTKERMLMNAIGVNGDPYVLMQTKYGEGGKFNIEEAKNNTGMKTIILDYIPGFSLFDWCGVIENATQIHAVSTSTLYLFELLELKATQIHLYPRKPLEQNFEYTEFLMTKPYILHDGRHQ